MKYKRKISITTGSRAEYGVIKPFLNDIIKSKKLELYLIVTGMHLSKKYGLTLKDIKKDGFKIYATIDSVPQGNTTFHMAKAVGTGICRFSEVFRKLKPDLNVIIGDRDEMLSSAIAAYHMNIPNVHIHGGEISGGIDEYNRHAITKMSNIHFAPTKKSKLRIIKMGEEPKYVFHTGALAIDEIKNNKISTKKYFEKKYGVKIDKDTIVLLQHPVTTESSSSKNQIIQTLNAIVKIGKQTISITPNSDAGNQEIFNNLKKYSKKYEFIKLFTSFPRNDYLAILRNCGVLVGNSSSGIIEASYFNTPVVNIGKRQEGREKSKNIINVSSNSSKSIYESILQAIKKKTTKDGKMIYGNGHASKKMISILEKIQINNNLIEKQLNY